VRGIIISTVDREFDRGLKEIKIINKTDGVVSTVLSY
jgi:hypothetical protein